MTETKQCPSPAAYQYRWGGLGELNYACPPHAQQLSNLCQHMCWSQQFERIPLGEEHQCGQQLATDDPDTIKLPELPETERGVV